MRVFVATALLSILMVASVPVRANSTTLGSATFDGHQIQLTAIPDPNYGTDYELFLDGSEILENSDSRSASIYGTFVFPDFSVALIALDDGGNEFDTSYFDAVVITALGKIVTGEFGGCGGATVSQENDSLVITNIILPDSLNSTPQTEESFTITKTGLSTYFEAAPPP